MTDHATRPAQTKTKSKPMRIRIPGVEIPPSLPIFSDKKIVIIKSQVFRLSKTREGGSGD